MSYSAHLFQALEAFRCHELADAGDDVERGLWIDVESGADCDGGGAGHDEFEGIGRGEDAAHADDGDGDFLVGLPDHAQGDRFDGRSGEAADRVGENGAACFDIDRHAEQGIDQADGIRARVFHRLRDAGDIGHVGRELDDERFSSSPGARRP